MKPLLRMASAAVTLTAAGCAFMPNHTFFVPPAQSPDTAWLRIVDNTEQTSLYQTINGNSQGGLIRASEWVLQHTQDRGMPKVSGEKYDSDYYETPLVAGAETEIVNVYVEGKHTCLVDTYFTPEKGKKYQFQLEADTLRYRCRVHASEMVQSNNGIWQLKPLHAVRYSAKAGNGWHDMHTSQ